MSMRTLIICLIIYSPLSFAQYVPTPTLQPEPCKGDTACQYRMQAEEEKKEKQIQEQKVQNYREEVLETQKAQLQETQIQNELLQEQIEREESQENQPEIQNDDQTNS